MRVFVCLIAIALLASVTGCGSGPTKPKEDIYPVAGVVKHNDAPLTEATLSFVPKGNTHGFTGSARTDKDGRYSVVDMHGNKGLVAGEYSVTFSRRVMPDGKVVPANDKTPPIESPATESLGPQLSDPSVSQITVTITKEKADYNFDLK